MLRHRRRSAPDDHVGSATTLRKPIRAGAGVSRRVGRAPLRTRALSPPVRTSMCPGPSERRWPLSLLAPVVLERDTEPDAKIHDGAVLDRQVLAHDLGHA